MVATYSNRRISRDGMYDVPIFGKEAGEVFADLVEISGVSIEDQRKQIKTSDIAFDMVFSTITATKAEPWQATADEIFGQSPIRIIFDCDGHAGAFAKNALVLTLKGVNLEGHAIELAQHDPGFHAFFEMIREDRAFRDLTGHGSGDRILTAVAFYIAGPAIDEVVAQVIAAGKAHGAVQQQDGLINVIMAKRDGTARPRVRVDMKAGMSGTSGSVLAVHMAAKLRAAFARHGINGFISMTATGPVTYASGFGAQGGLPAFDHAAAHLVDIQAIAARIASLHGYSGPLFDVYYLLDLEYSVAADGTVIYPSAADRDAFLRKTGATGAMLNLLHGRSSLAGDVTNFKRARPEEVSIAAPLSTIACRMVALDKPYLREGAQGYGAIVGLRQLAGHRDRNDPDPQRSRSEGQKSAETLHTASVDGLEAKVLSEGLSPLRFTFTKGRDGDDRDDQHVHVAIAGETLRDRAEHLAAQRAEIEARVSGVLAEDRNTVLRSLRARQAEGLPDRYFVQGIADDAAEQLPEAEERRTETKQRLDAAQIEVDKVLRRLDRVHLWTNVPRLLQRAEDTINEYASAWFEYELWSAITRETQAYVGWLNGLIEAAVIAARLAVPAVEQLEEMFANRAASVVDRFGLGPILHDRSMIEALVEPESLYFDPDEFSRLEGTSAVVAAALSQADAVVAPRIGKIQTVQAALAAKARYLAPECTDEEISEGIDAYFTQELSFRAKEAADGCNARFDGDTQTMHYLVSNRADLPDVKRNITTVVLPDVATEMPFVCILRVQHGARLDSLPWFTESLLRIVPEPRYPFTVPISDSEFITSLAPTSGLP